jgi:hypothetical protein
MHLYIKLYVCCSVHIEIYVHKQYIQIERELEKLKYFKFSNNNIERGKYKTNETQSTSETGSKHQLNKCLQNLQLQIQMQQYQEQMCQQ